jgi:hypothetical protein
MNDLKRRIDEIEAGGRLCLFPAFSIRGSRVTIDSLNQFFELPASRASTLYSSRHSQV